jgi:hypothetical protein
MRFFKREPEVHAVAVFDTRPLPDDRKPFEPYFVAICDCGWVGDIWGTSEEAFKDAYHHDLNVSEEIQRPVG